jgi:hypothetical protein
MNYKLTKNYPSLPFGVCVFIRSDAWLKSTFSTGTMKHKPSPPEITFKGIRSHANFTSHHSTPISTNLDRDSRRWLATAFSKHHTRP